MSNLSLILFFLAHSLRLGPALAQEGACTVLPEIAKVDSQPSADDSTGWEFRFLEAHRGWEIDETMEKGIYHANEQFPAGNIPGTQPLISRLELRGAVVKYGFGGIEKGKYGIIKMSVPGGGLIDIQHRGEDIMTVSGEGKDKAEQTRAFRFFLEAVSQSQAMDSFFRRNAFALQEAEVRRRLANPGAARQTRTLPVEDLATGYLGGIALLPDIHGMAKPIEVATSFVRLHHPDWVLMEHFPKSMQTALDDFLSAPLLSVRFLQARKAIKAHLTQLGLYYGKIPASKHPFAKVLSDRKTKEQLAKLGVSFEVVPFSEHPIFKLLWECRRVRTRLIASELEHEGLRDWGRGMSKTGMGIRNHLWADLVPSKSRGLVVGGGDHFEDYPGIRFQDFLSYADTVPAQLIDWHPTDAEQTTHTEALAKRLRIFAPDDLSARAGFRR